MNFYKSTEKALRLLKGKNKVITKRAIQTKALDVYVGTKQNKCVFPRNVTNNVRLIFNSKIKLQLPIRNLSTERQIAPPFINPNKPPPSLISKVATKPIVPLTYPRFPKNAGTIAPPSVTKILQDTMPASSRYMLDRWREAMIKKLGVAGFNQYTAETFERGRALHALIAKYLLQQGEPVEELSKEVVANLWRSIEKVVRERLSNVRLVEHIVTHSAMNYRGIVDAVATYEDELVVIDFKTAEKPKKNVDSLYDNPLQVTAYCGAINNDSSIPLDVIDRNINSGLVIVAYLDGSEASVYYLNSDQVTRNYWLKWIDRLDQFSRMSEMREVAKKKDVIIKKE